MFGLGLSACCSRSPIGTVKTISGFQPVKIPLLGDIPVIGRVFFQQSLPGVRRVPAGARWPGGSSTRRPWGLKIKAVGQNPAAADSLGVSVNRVRYFSVCLGAAPGRPGRRLALASRC